MSKTHNQENRVTLDAKHKERMRYFKELKRTLPQKNKTLNDLKIELKILSQIENSQLTKEQIDHKFFLSDRIKNLEEEIKDIEDGKEEQEYYLNTASLLYIYYDNLDKTANEKEDKDDKIIVTEELSNSPPINNMDTYFQSTDKFKRADILDKYMKRIDPTYFSKFLYEKNYNICTHCNVEMVLVRSEGILLCETCCRIEYVVVCSEKPMHKEHSGADISFVYKRGNHVLESAHVFSYNFTTYFFPPVLEKILIRVF